MAAAGPKPTTQRTLALVVLVAAGIVGLPVAAAFLDGPSTEDLVLPVHVAVVAALGAVVGALLPGVAGAGSSRARGAGIGVLVGVAAALVGAALFYLLLN
ncbi:MAG TPA: hypothetical protein VER39_09075 [Nocardioidaceae bacterium]|nr:hypothetical protein [Nocardioidaceae bacterium]